MRIMIIICIVLVMTPIINIVLKMTIMAVLDLVVNKKKMRLIS